MRDNVVTAQFVDICEPDELWDGEMDSFEVNGEEILLLKHEGRFLAFQGHCPHQDIPLVEGKLEKGILTCRAHLWQFDAVTGKGVNPSNCQLKQYPVRIVGNMVQVGDAPVQSGS